MSEHTMTVRGVVRNGVVVLNPPAALPEGAEVEVGVLPTEFTPEERAEFETWDRASAEAFRVIEDLERQEGDGSW